METKYEAQDFKGLLGTAGMSDQLLTNHFVLYEGYVKNVNALLELLAAKEPGTPEYAELKRRFGWEWNGMRLHELYFGNMKGNEKLKMKNEELGGEKGEKAGSGVGSRMLEVLENSFGSFEKWRKDFVGTGTMRGIGWVILAKDPQTGMLFNTWINEHDGGHLSGAMPILVMDVFEHAFMLDYGLKRADYIEAFFKAIDWSVVEKRA